MTRRKTKLVLIANETERRTSYKKRKKSMLKKAEELSTLCGVDACAIVYGPYSSQPETWPPEKEAVESVLKRFENVPEWEQGKKMVNQESFITENIQKIRDKKKKMAKDNKEKEMTLFMYQCLNSGINLADPRTNFNPADLSVLTSVIDQNLREVGRKMEEMKVSEPAPMPMPMPTPQQLQPQIEAPVVMAPPPPPPLEQMAPPPPPLPLPPLEQMVAPMNYGHGGSDMMNNDPLQSQWLMDLLNGNGDETLMMPPAFGEVNLPL